MFNIYICILRFYILILTRILIMHIYIQWSMCIYYIVYRYSELHVLNFNCIFCHTYIHYTLLYSICVYNICIIQYMFVQYVHCTLYNVCCILSSVHCIDICVLYVLIINPLEWKIKIHHLNIYIYIYIAQTAEYRIYS